MSCRSRRARREKPRALVGERGSAALSVAARAGVESAWRDQRRALVVDTRGARGRQTAWRWTTRVLPSAITFPSRKLTESCSEATLFRTLSPLDELDLDLLSEHAHCRRLSYPRWTRDERYTLAVSL
jgi:hypothetical protein